MKSFVVLLLALWLAGCSAGASNLLEGSANDVPLFQPSRLQSFKTLKIEWVENNKRQTNEWVWKTTSPTVDVKAFYQKGLPGAKVVEADGNTTYTWTGFPGADKDEDVTVIVQGDGVFRISECLAPKKSKHRDEIVKAFPKDNDLPKDFK
jgi:hypothetical protein